MSSSLTDSAEVLEILNKVEKEEQLPGFEDYYYWENFTDGDYPIDPIELCGITRPQNRPAQALTTAISIFGILLNCTVIYVMAVLHEYRKSKQHWLLLQLFVANVMFLLFVFLQMINEHHGIWIMGDTMCRFDEATIFTSRSAGVLFLTISNLLGTISVTGITFKWLPSCPSNQAIEILKNTAIILCAWLPSVLVNLPLYKYNNINDCGHCVLEFPIEIGELCNLLGLNPSACHDVVDFFNKDFNANRTEAALKSDVELDYSSGSPSDTFDFDDKVLESNITEMAEMIICDYEEPKSFFVWLLATFTLFFAIPVPIVLTFLCAWIYIAVCRRQNKEATLLRVILALDIVFICCWTPWNAIHMRKAYGGLGKEGHQCASLLHFARLSALMYNAFSPIIYVILTKDFGVRMFKAMNVSISVCYDILKTTEKSPPESTTKLSRANSHDFETTVTTDSTDSLNSPVATPV